MIEKSFNKELNEMLDYFYEIDYADENAEILNFLKNKAIDSIEEANNFLKAIIKLK